MRLPLTDIQDTGGNRPVACNRGCRARRPAVTLTEMLVVLGVVVVALGLAIPAFSVWESRKIQDAINQTSGLLKSAQVKALTEHRTLGLFFYIDPDDGTQVIWPIEEALAIDSPEATVDHFQLRDTAPFKLPAPMRVVPASVLEFAPPSPFYWTPEQLVKDNVYEQNPPGAPDPPYLPADPATGIQFHRNFFVMLFGETGSVITDRRVIIVDFEKQATLPAAVSPGYRTRLLISGTDNTDYGAGLIVDRNDDIAAQPLLFVPTDRLLIYRDDVFRVQGDTQDLVNYNDNHKVYLRINADPLFVHKVTGEIIKGDRVPPEGA
jgi:type II secretory pathway pseudopilin PulG